MNSSRDDCCKRSALGWQFLFGSAILLFHLTTEPMRADSWQQRAPVPGGRAAHSAVWTGREMIVWGGGIDGSFLNTGARYVPSTDTWQTTSPYGAPAPRWFHAAVWTGQEMILWGGRANFFPNDHYNDGARYNPSTDTWTPISGYGAPTPRSQCVAVWTGEEMIVWGGETDGGAPLADGAAYNPVTDQWRPINASGLAGRMEPTAVWTGSEMIIFGGVDATQPGWLSFGDGARYNPFTDSWTPLPTAGAPGSRTGHTAVWTGERMIVWGGRHLPSDSRLNDGAIYSPGSDTWTGISPYDAPQARMYHAAVWTGTEMIVWGGDAGSLLDTGARYNPATGIWTPTTQNNAPRKRMFWRPDLGIWTGHGMLVCAGSDYPASLDSTALYTVFDPPCPPVIREQPQSVSVLVGSPVTLAVGAQDCGAGSHPSATQISLGPEPQGFEFQTGARAGELQFDYDFFSIPDSLRVYYEGQRIFDSDLSGQGTIRVPFGPGSAQSVNIVVNEDGGPASTAWEYTVSFRAPPLRYQWRKNGVALAGETAATLHFAAVGLADAGDYSVVVANNNSAVVSAVATLTVQPNPPTNCVPAPSDLVAWWPFDGTFKDVVSQSGLMIVGAPAFVAGKAGQALRFDGVDDGARFPASAALNVGTSEGFSIELWVNPQNVTLQPLVVWSQLGNFEGAHFWVGGYGAGSIYANVVDVNGGQHSWRSDTGLVTVNEWQHVGMSYDKPAGLLRFYLNGQKVTEHVLGSLTPLTGSDVEVGYHSLGGEHFAGAMDELSIYRRALSDAEMRSIFNAGAAGKCPAVQPPCALPGLVAWWRGDGDAKDVTGAHDGELLFGTTFSPGISGQAFTFDLSRARVSIPDDDAFKLTNSLSFEGWINVASYAPGIIFIRGDNRGGLDPYYMSMQPSGQLHWGIDTADNDFAAVQSPGAVSTGVWTHVAAVLDGATGNMGLYVNGSLVNQTNTSLRPLRDLDPNWEPALGIGNAGGTFHHFPFHGSVDEWALYSRALSAAEIQGIYNAGAAGKCGTNAPPSPAGAYDLARDFSPTQNPSGVWSYGYETTLGGAFTLLTFPLTSFADNPVPVDSWSKNGYEPVAVYHNGTTNTSISDGGAGVFPPGTTWFYPGVEGHIDNYGVIRFTVPASGAGTYQLETAVRAYLDGPRSGDTDFHVLRNGVELFGEFVAGNSGTSFSSHLNLAVGDRIDFAVGRGRDGIAFDSGLKIRAVLVLVTNPPPTNCVAVPTGLVAWWRGDGDATDATGAHDGTLLYGTTFSPGVAGQAFTFDLSRARVSIPDDEAFKLTDSLSFEGWINVASYAPGLIFIRGDNRGGLDPYLMSMQPSGQLHWGINTAENNFAALDSPGVMATGVWTHVAAVLDGATGNMGLYVNGVLVNQTNTTLRPLRDLDPNWEPTLGIGNHGGTFHHFPFHGSVDEWALYSRALSAAEIQGIYNAGTAGKCTNAPSQVDLVFNGSFEMATVAPGTIDGLSSTAIIGWTVRDIDYYGSPWVAGDGLRSLDMNGWIPGTISQEVSGFVVGQSYRLAFLMAGNPYFIPPLPAVKRLRVTIGTASHEYSFDATGHTDSDLGWISQTLEFTATSPVMDLTFSSLTESAGGAALDKVSITLLTNPPPPAAVYDVSQDFSPTSNPTGAWSYGYSATFGGQFNLLTFAKTFGANNGVPISAWQVSDVWGPTVNRVMGNGIAVSEGGAFTAPSGTVYVWPGNDGSPGVFGVIRFTVPAGGGGVYRIASAVRPTFDGPVSGDTDFHVLKNGQELFGQFLAPNAGTGYSNVVTLASGDSIDFVVGRGADGSPDHSSLKVHAVIALVTNVPPPTNHMFDLSADFSLAANPNGPWSYGHFSASITGNLALLNTTRTFGAENGVPIDIWQLNNAKPWVAKVIGPDTAVSTHFNGPPGTIYFGPDPDAVPRDFAAIRFTVPPGAAGTYRLETAVRSLYDSTRSVDADFHVVKNGAELFGRLVPPNSGTAYSNTLALVAGDRIDFVAGRGTNGLPETGLKIQATLKSIVQASMSVDSVSFLASGGVRVIGHAPPGTICFVERSTNLMDWGSAGSAVEVASGVFEFIDSQPPAGPACFYRLRGQ